MLGSRAATKICHESIACATTNVLTPHQDLNAVDGRRQEAVADGRPPCGVQLASDTTSVSGSQPEELYRVAPTHARHVCSRPPPMSARRALGCTALS